MDEHECYEEQDCRCYEIECVVEKEFGEMWHAGDGCDTMIERLDELKDALGGVIKFPPHSDIGHECQCPACGRLVCGNCI